MPEGDTIHRVRAALAPALVGKVLRRFEAPRLVGASPRPGESVESVDAVGKHLLMRFSGGLTLETHMRMTGSWHLYRPRQSWQKPQNLLRCLVEVDDWVAVCFSAPIVRTHPTAIEGTALDPIAHLGPDLCDEGSAHDAVVEDCVTRMARFGDPDADVGVALLDQRIANGVGNVYRSEVCWHCGVDPRRPLRSVAVADRRRLITTAGRLLRANLATGSRATVPGGLAVYGRRGGPCRRCGTRIESGSAGEQNRVAYWCPTCQR